MVATHTQADAPPMRQPVLSAATTGEAFSLWRISAWTGTSAVDVDWADAQIAPAVTDRPIRSAKNREILAKGTPRL